LFISISLVIIGNKYTAFFKIIGDLFSWNYLTRTSRNQKGKNKREKVAQKGRVKNTLY